MNNKLVLSALIGLVGAVGNNGKTENTDSVIKSAILFDAENSEITEEEVVKKIHKEKFAISPNCASCKSPCGNTSDYDISKFDYTAPAVLELKRRVFETLKAKIGKLNELPDVAYKGLAYLGYDFDESTYEELIEEILKEGK